MDKEQKKALREKFEARRPVMGIVALTDGDDIWIAVSTDAAADRNSTMFQLQLGSWPNRELQKAYSDHPDRFAWSVIRELKYEERDDDHRDELELMYLMCLDEHPGAKQMRAGRH